MKYRNNLIELQPFLPVSQPVTEPVAASRKDALQYLSAWVENLVTVGIGVCFVMGLVISLIIAL